MSVLWVTSFSKDMWEASGRGIVHSFHNTGTEGTLLVCHEGLGRLEQNFSNVREYDLDGDSFLHDWLRENAEWIPQHLGGKNDGRCRCPGGPYDVHSKLHRMPCIGHWFNRNASRWFRKIASLNQAEKILEQDRGYEMVVWVDADCCFIKKTDFRTVEVWFQDAAVFYFKSRREVLESGIVGYFWNRGGSRIFQWMKDCYGSGRYRQLSRWDDGYVTQKALKNHPNIPCVDLAREVGPHAAVIPLSVVGSFIDHDKGRHGRKLGIMT